MKYKSCEAYLVGIGETKVGKLPGKTAIELQAEAVRRAIADAGFEKEDIDAVYTLDPYSYPVVMHSMLLSEYLGIKPTLAATIDVGGTASPMSMILHGIDAIEKGRAEVVVCVFGENALTGRVPEANGLPLQSQMGTEEFEDPFGALGMVVSYALLAQRYIEKYNIPDGAFAPVVEASRKYALLNENAHIKKRFSLDEYLSSPWIARPLRRMDCCPISDGAGAVVLTSKRKIRERNIKHTPVSVLGFGSKITHKIVSQMPDIDQLGMSIAAARAFEEAKITKEDIDLLLVHDAFTISVILTLEALGFCDKGEAPRYITGGTLELEGELPTNTHGGLLSQGHVGGILHIVEAVRQLRGDSGRRQVENAEIAFVAGNGGVFSNCGALILGKGGG